MFFSLVKGLSCSLINQWMVSVLHCFLKKVLHPCEGIFTERTCSVLYVMPNIKHTRFSADPDQVDQARRVPSPDFSGRPEADKAVFFVFFINY